MRETTIGAMLHREHILLDSGGVKETIGIMLHKEHILLNHIKCD